MKRTVFALCAAALLAGSAPAPAMAQQQQPISYSMVECAVIYSVISRSAKARGRDEDTIKRFGQMSANFMEAAAAQAAAEGVEDINAHITDIYKEVSPEWDSKLGSILQLPDTLEWIQYCGALAHSRGIVPE